MRFLSVISLFVLTCVGNAQTFDSLILNSNSILKKLLVNDSLVYYQCHVEEAIQQLSTASGQTLTGNSQKYSITEKFVITKTQTELRVNYYTSSLAVFPNKKFSGLKIREKSYWDFKKTNSFTLNEHDLKILLALERKGREAIEYDYAINKYTTNQLIIKLKKDFKQLVIDGEFVISKMVERNF